MSYKFRHALTSVLLFIFVLSGMVMFTAGDQAWGQGCTLQITKESRGANIGFDFQSVQNNVVSDFFLFNDNSQGIGFGPVFDVTVTEIVPAGWRLEDVICFNDGVVTTEIENGIVATCSDPDGGFAECIFINVNPADIPTLSEWGMIAAAVGLGLVGLVFAVRRRKIQAGA